MPKLGMSGLGIFASEFNYDWPLDLLRYLCRVFLVRRQHQILNGANP